MTTRRPRDLVFTLFGEYLLDRGEDVWVGSLIELLAPFDLNEGAIRTTLSRMTNAGWLESERAGRHSFYRLTPRGRRLLEEGQARIYRDTRPREWDGSWLLLAYSIPEEHRRSRDRLRDGLAWLGFGSLGNGLWISAHDIGDDVAAFADELGITQYVETFRSRRVGEGSDEELVGKCWDLTSLAERYGSFVNEWRPLLELARAGKISEGRQSYADRFELIHQFRAFPLSDPHLPDPLLPADWPGDEAAALFREVHDALVPSADEYVASVLADSPALPAPASGR